MKRRNRQYLKDNIKICLTIEQIGSFISTSFLSTNEFYDLPIMFQMSYIMGNASFWGCLNENIYMVNLEVPAGTINSELKEWGSNPDKCLC